MTEKDTAETVVEAESTDDVMSLSEMFDESEAEESEVTEVAAESEADDDQGDTEETVEAKAETETQ